MNKEKIILRLGRIRKKSDHPFSKILINSLRDLLEQNLKTRTILERMKEKIEYEKDNSYAQKHKRVVGDIERLYKDIKQDYDNHQEIINRVANL